MLTIGGRALADVYCNIKNTPLDTAYQLALREGGALKMKASHDTVGGHALVVLHELDGTHLLIKLALREAFKEITTGVIEHTGLDDDYAIDSGFYYFHVWVGCWLLAVSYWLLTLEKRKRRRKRKPYSR